VSIHVAQVIVNSPFPLVLIGSVDGLGVCFGVILDVGY
jgi:hypothetical protein